MTDESGHKFHAHAFEIPAGVVQAMAQRHDAGHARAQDRYLSAMRWLDGLDVEGLMALRWVLSSDADDAYGNSRFYDGMVMQLLRAKGVDPQTGVDPAVQLLQGGSGPAV